MPRISARALTFRAAAIWDPVSMSPTMPTVLPMRSGREKTPAAQAPMYCAAMSGRAVSGFKK